MLEELLARTRTASPERMTDPVGGPYPEEVLLEAYDLEWEAIDLRRRRLQKTWQQFVLIEEMEVEELKYRRTLQRLQDQEIEREKQMMRELEERRAAEQEAARREQEREEALMKERERRKAEKEREKRKAEKRRQEQEEALLQREKEKREKLKAKKRKKKKQEQLVSNDTRTSEEETETDVDVKKVKSKVVKAKKTQPKKTKVAKRITPISLPPEVQTEDDTSVSDENQVDFGGYDSPTPELPDDGLLNMLDKGSDSDIDDEPSMMSLILPVAHSSPKRVQPSPLKKKILTPQKRFGKKGGPPLDFNFTNAEAKRQAKAAEAAARAEQEDDDEADSEPEPTPPPTTSTPKKHLKRRKEAAKKAGNATASAAGKSLMSAMANSSIAVKVKKVSKADKKAAPASNIGRKKTAGNSTGNASKGRQVNAKSEAKSKSPEGDEEEAPVPAVRRKAGGNGEKMSIKQRLASAELLSRISKMQDINTPKVLGKKTMKGQKKAPTETLAAKRAEFRKALTSDPSEPDVPRRNQAVEDGDLNISLNSSGLISDNDSPENLRAPTRKRPREAGDGEVTPTKKLQFFEITKRLVKSPMPRFLRTPTPLMSPVISSALVKPRAASPAPSRRATAEASKDYPTRRMNSAPARPKKTTNVNRFGGSANSTAGGGRFSMFDAFVNSGSSGAIPRLKTKTPGDVSPSV